MKDGYIVLTYRFEKLPKRWTANCEELGTATFGRSLPEAERKLDEAVWLHLSALEEVGERERFFKENGIKLYHAKPKDILVSLPVKEAIFVHPHVQSITALA